MNKKILVIAPSIFSMGEGGGTQTTFETLKGYHRHGFEVTVLCITNKEDAKPFKYHGIKVEYFKIPINVFSAEYDVFNSVFDLRIFRSTFLNALAWRFFGLVYVIFGLIKVRKLLKQQNFDLLYCYTSLSIPIGSIVNHLYGIPNISRILGIRYGHEELRKFPNQFLIFPDYLQYKWPCTLMIMTDDGTVGDNTALEMGVKPEKLRFWKNGINIRNTDSCDRTAIKRNLGVNDCRKIIMSVCRLAPEKRVDLLIRSLPYVLERFEDVHYLIIGDGRHKRSLEEYCHRSGCDGHVSFTGTIPNWEIYKYYAIADICVSLSIYGTLVNSTIEAMGYGKSIIVANVGDIEEKLTHEVDAIILAENTPECLGDEILRLLVDEDLRKRLQENAKRKFASQFMTWEERMDYEIMEIKKVVFTKS